jgi:hypothetical protein
MSAPSKWQTVNALSNHAYQIRETAHGHITIEPRPAYCDRGRFLVRPLPLHGPPCPSCAVDDQDGFPRYYFDETRAKLEVQAWIEARGWDME